MFKMNIVSDLQRLSHNIAQRLPEWKLIQTITKGETLVYQHNTSNIQLRLILQPADNPAQKRIHYRSLKCMLIYPIQPGPITMMECSCTIGTGTASDTSIYPLIKTINDSHHKYQHMIFNYKLLCSIIEALDFTLPQTKNQRYQTKVEINIKPGFTQSNSVSFASIQLFSSMSATTLFIQDDTIAISGQDKHMLELSDPNLLDNIWRTVMEEQARNLAGRCQTTQFTLERAQEDTRLAKIEITELKANMVLLGRPSKKEKTPKEKPA